MKLNKITLGDKLPPKKVPLALGREVRGINPPFFSLCSSGMLRHGGKILLFKFQVLVIFSHLKTYLLWHHMFQHETQKLSG